MSTLDNPSSTEANNVSYRPVALRAGIVAGLILIALTLVLQLTGVADPTDPDSSTNWLSSVVSFLVMTGAIVWAIQSHRSDQGGYVTFGRGLTVGLVVTLIIGLIATIWSILYFTVIQPDMVEQMLEASREQMYKRQPNMSDEEIDQAMGMMSWMFNPYMLAVIGFIGNLFFGLIISLISAAILKKNPPETM